MEAINKRFGVVPLPLSNKEQNIHTSKKDQEKIQYLTV